MIDICKLTAALVFAAIAGLTTIAAGLLSDVRITVILMRTACIFFATGVLVYIGAFLFERLGYGSLIKETEKAMQDLKQKEKQEKSEPETEQDASAKDEDNSEDKDKAPQKEEGAQDGFAPLNTDSLRKVTGSSET